MSVQIDKTVNGKGKMDKVRAGKVEVQRDREA